MRVDFYGLAFETPRITFYLYSPWRASALEHRLFDALRSLGLILEKGPDEQRLEVKDAAVFGTALTTMSRILKGWQEEAEQGRERRFWRWLFEADTDDHGYDHAGEPASMWAFLRLAVDRANLDEAERAEEVDMNGLGIRIWPNK